MILYNQSAIIVFAHSPDENGKFYKRLYERFLEHVES